MNTTEKLTTEAPIDGFGPNARGRSECALELIAEADHLFADAGHAIAWALTQIGSVAKIGGSQR